MTSTDGAGFPTRVKELYGGSEAVEIGFDDVMAAIFNGCCQSGRKHGEADCRKLELKSGGSRLVRKLTIYKKRNFLLI